MTTVMEDLCYMPVTLDQGVPMNVPGYEGWRFVVQAAIVTPETLLPFMLPAKLGGPRWRDITGDVQGIEWGRGGPPAQRPMAGELTMRLINTGSKYAPWRNPFYGPGTLLRVAIGDGTVTKTQFTGMTQSWLEASQGTAAGSGYRWVDVVVWELLFLLAGSDDNALAGVVGGGETLTQRIARLLAKAEWQFGYHIESTSTATFQATDHAQDMASELYVTVDSIDAVAYPGKDGELQVRDRATGNGVHWTYANSDHNPDAFVTENDDVRLLSSVDLARVGGTAKTFTNLGIAGRYQKRTTKRNDLITVAEPGDADLDRVATAMLARSDQTYRPVSFDIESGQGSDGLTTSPLLRTETYLETSGGSNVAVLLIESDITDRITIQRTLDDLEQALVDNRIPLPWSVTFADYAICAIATAIQVTAGGTYWRGTIFVDIEADSGWTIS